MADARAREGYDLGIDTASDVVSFALFPAGDDRPAAVQTVEVQTTVGRELLGALDAFLDAAGVARSDIGRIAVTTGPGQYGALRAGIATAQGIALALGVPLAGVPRLEADAALVRPTGGDVVVAVHQTRTGPAWGAYEVITGDAPREVIAPAITSWEEALTSAPQPAVWTGELDETFTPARDAAGRTGDTVADTPSTPRAVAVVRIARVRDAFGDPGLVDAIYLRPPPITRPRER